MPSLSTSPPLRLSESTPELPLKMRFLRSAATSVARLAPLAALGLTATTAFGAAPPQGKSDTVYRYNTRTEKTQTIQGEVTKDALDGLSIKRGKDKVSDYDAAEIIQVIWGEIPDELGDARKFVKRGDFESALASFSAAASSDAREPVRAVARLEAIEAAMAWGATERAHLADAIAEADRFISEFSTSRHLPKVRALKARASWLNGAPEVARDGYKALFESGDGGTEGYLPFDVADAALQGGLAAFAAGDASGGLDLLARAATAYAAIEPVREGDEARAKAGAEVASLGDALAKVARGDASGAKGSLERAIDSKETDAAKFQARLALGRALLADGKAAEAQLEFARVASLDYTSADRRAEAMLGMAERAIAANPDGGVAEAKGILQRVVRSYGSTPAAASAAKMLETM